MPYPFRNLVFEGGGVKGIPCTGSIKTISNSQGSGHFYSDDWQRTIITRLSATSASPSFHKLQKRARPQFHSNN